MKILSERYKVIKEQVDQFVLLDDVESANKAIKIITKIAEGYRLNNSELYLAYSELLSTLKFIALPIINKQGVLALLIDNLQLAIDITEYDFYEKIKAFLVNNTQPQERDEIKKEIINILQRNKALLTSGVLINGSRPTLENWIKKYIGFVGLGEVDLVKFNQFFVEDKDYTNLNDEKKTQVRRFFDFYEKLKLSSLTARGIEDVIPIANDKYRGYLKNGEMIKNESIMDPETERLYEFASSILSGAKKESDVFEELNKPITSSAPIKPLIVGNSAIAVPPPPSIPTPLVVRESAFGMPVRPVLTAEQTKQIAELTALATSYAEGSLERRVIEDEVKKIEQKA